MTPLSPACVSFEKLASSLNVFQANPEMRARPGTDRGSGAAAGPFFGLPPNMTIVQLLGSIGITFCYEYGWRKCVYIMSVYKNLCLVDSAHSAVSSSRYKSSVKKTNLCSSSSWSGCDFWSFMDLSKLHSVIIPNLVWGLAGTNCNVTWVTDCVSELWLHFRAGQNKGIPWNSEQVLRSHWNVSLGRTMEVALAT